MYEVSYRPAELAAGKFTRITTAPSPEHAQDEILGWMGPTPYHGDLVRVRKIPDEGMPLGNLETLEGPYERLHVFDPYKRFVEVDPHIAHVSWVNFWEKSANLNNMLDVAKLVDPRRLVLTACDFAEISIQDTGRRRGTYTSALKLARDCVQSQEGLVPALRTTREGLTAEALTVPATNRTAAVKAVFLAVSIAETVSAEPKWDELPVADKGRITNEMFKIAFCAMSSLNTNRRYVPSANQPLKTFIPLLRRYVPLSVLACSLVGAQDPLPIPYPKVT